VVAHATSAAQALVRAAPARWSPVAGGEAAQEGEGASWRWGVVSPLPAQRWDRPQTWMIGAAAPPLVRSQDHHPAWRIVHDAGGAAQVL